MLYTFFDCFLIPGKLTFVNYNMIERINFIVNHFQISPSKFADEIGVQRANISHILSGRNKPSLDFIQKILIRWNEINPQWLLLGKGEFLLKDYPNTKNEMSDFKTLAEYTNNSISTDIPIDAKSISKIIVLYSNGTFDEYLK